MAIYYVATNGDNGDPGTLSEPWLTLAYAESQLSDGDTVYVRGGTYHEMLTINVANVTFQNYTGESPIIDGQWTLPVNDEGIWVYPMSQELITACYMHMVALLAPGVTFDGFEIKNISGVGLKVHGYYDDVYNVDVKNCLIHDTYQYALQISHDANNVLIEDCEFYGGAYCVEALCDGNGGLCRGEGYPGDPAQITTPHTDAITFRRCIIRDSYNEGINLEHGSNDITVEYCEIYGNKKMQLYAVSSTNHTIRYNMIYGTERNLTGTLGGAGIEITHEWQWIADEGNPIITNHKIYGNLIANVNNGVIVGGASTNSSQNINVYNNTIIHNRQYGISVASGVGQNSNFENNIIWNPLGEISNVPSGINFDHNLWSETPDADSQGANDPTYAVPLLIKTTDWNSLIGGELDGSEFVLQNTSPAIDAGTNLGVDYDEGLDPSSTWVDSISLLDQDDYGSGWEIGAFVFDAGYTLVAASGQYGLTGQAIDLDKSSKIVIEPCSFGVTGQDVTLIYTPILGQTSPGIEVLRATTQFDGDVAYVLTPDGGQITYVGGQPVMDVGGLENAVNISLFTGMGWWANALNENEPDKQIGSDFEERTKPKAINTVYLRDVEDAARDALQWMISQKIAQTVKAIATWPELNSVNLEILITKPDGDIVTYKHELNWESGLFYPVTAKVEGF